MKQTKISMVREDFREAVKEIRNLKRENQKLKKEKQNLTEGLHIMQRELDKVKEKNK